MTRSLTVVHLYPDEMDTYGDSGNVLAVKRRLEWNGYQAEVVKHHTGDTLREDADIILGGGGQNSCQVLVQDDLERIADPLRQLAENDVPILVICGLYQLFGKSFRMDENTVLPGLGILDVVTESGESRSVGDIVVDSPWGTLVGYENHAGQTFLGDQASAVGTVLSGNGNNGKDTTEGSRYRNVVGTYLHGPVLPRNPGLADFLISAAIERKFGEPFSPRPLDDTLSAQARATVIDRAGIASAQR